MDLAILLRLLTHPAKLAITSYYFFLSSKQHFQSPKSIPVFLLLFRPFKNFKPSTHDFFLCFWHSVYPIRLNFSDFLIDGVSYTSYLSETSWIFLLTDTFDAVFNTTQLARLFCSFKRLSNTLTSCVLHIGFLYNITLFSLSPSSWDHYCNNDRLG